MNTTKHKNDPWEQWKAQILKEAQEFNAECAKRKSLADPTSTDAPDCFAKATQSREAPQTIAPWIRHGKAHNAHEAEAKPMKLEVFNCGPLPEGSTSEVGQASPAQPQPDKGQEYRDAPQERKRELAALGLKAGATFIPSLDGFVISEGDLWAVTSDRDQYKAHAQALAEALQRLYASDPYASPDFYMKASDNAKAKLAAWKARRQ